MGQKVHPYGFRLGYTKPWKSRWFVERDYDKLLLEDVKLRNELKDKLKSAGVSSIEIERPGNKLRVIIKTARPGIIIGRKGAEIDKLKAGRAEAHRPRGLHRYSGSAQAGAGRATGVGVDRAATGKARGLPPRHAQGGGFGAALRLQGNQGRVSGRLNGNEIARSEWYLQGRLPLHTLRADIDYGFTEARTTYGVIGVKCWVYKGEILPRQETRTAAGRRRILRLRRFAS